MACAASGLAEPEPAHADDGRIPGLDRCAMCRLAALAAGDTTPTAATVPSTQAPHLPAPDLRAPACCGSGGATPPPPGFARTGQRPLPPPTPECPRASARWRCGWCRAGPSKWRWWPRRCRSTSRRGGCWSSPGRCAPSSPPASSTWDHRPLRLTPGPAETPRPRASRHDAHQGLLGVLGRGAPRPPRARALPCPPAPPAGQPLTPDVARVAGVPRRGVAVVEPAEAAARHRRCDGAGASGGERGHRGG